MDKIAEQQILFTLGNGEIYIGNTGDELREIQ